MRYPSKYLPWKTHVYLPWLILLFAAVSKIFSGGNRRAFGSFVAEFRKEYKNVTLSELNWIGDSYAAVGYLFSSLCTASILYFDRRYGLFQFVGALFVLASCIACSFVPDPHWLFLTHTVLNGIGSSIIMSIVALVVNEHFDKEHSYYLVATTLVSGGPVASIIFVPTFAYLIQHYNWRMAFILIGIIYFLMYGSAAMVFRKKESTSYSKDKFKFSFHCNDIKAKQYPLLVLWFLDRIITSIVTYGLILNLTDFIYRANPNLVRSSILTTLYAAGEGVAYVLGATITAATKGFFRDKLKFIMLISSIIACICLLSIEFVNAGILRQILVFITGLSMGPSNMFIFPGGEELTLLKGHIAYPFSLAGLGIGTLLSPLLTAKLAEIFSYKWFFLAQGSMIFIKAVFVLIITMLLLCCPVYLEKDDDYIKFLDDITEIEVDKQSLALGETKPLISEGEKAPRTY